MRRRSDDTDARCSHTDARYSQDAQVSVSGPLQACLCLTAKDDDAKPGVRFLAQSKRREVSGLRRSTVEQDD